MCQLKASVQAMRATRAAVNSPKVRQAPAACNKVARRKRRQYRQQRMTGLLAQMNDPTQSKQFWNALRLRVQRMPQQLQLPSAWTDAMQNAINSAGSNSPMEAGIMEASPPAADVATLAYPMTRDEVMGALRALKDQRACKTFIIMQLKGNGASMIETCQGGPLQLLSG